MNILFTCAGRRNYLLKFFKQELECKLIATDASTNAPALMEADYAHVVPDIYHKDYISEILTICKHYDIKLIISLNDLELPILAENKDLFEKNGVFPLVSPSEVIELSFDKTKTNSFLYELGIQVPQTWFDVESVHKDVEKKVAGFPMVIKPRWGSASIGIQFPNNMDELTQAYDLLMGNLQRTILGKVSSQDSSGSLIIQEKLPGDEYGLDIINDLEGKYCATIVKKKLGMRSGETDKAVTVYNDKLQELGKKIGTSLKHVGNLDCDVFETNDGFKVLEMNPRFGGGYPFSHTAGVNLPRAISYWMQGQDAPEECFSYKEGVLSAKCDNIVPINNEKLFR